MLASVIIYTYKRKDFILNAVNSVLSQSMPRKDFELIIVKSFLDEEIDNYIQEVSDKMLYVDDVTHGKKLSPAIQACKGDVIFFMDDDDEFYPTKLEEVLKYFNSNESVTFVHNSISKIDEEGNSINGKSEQVPKSVIKLDTELMGKREISDFFKYRANWYSSCMAFKRTVFEGKVNFIDRVYQSVDPFLFLCALSTKGEMIKIPDRLTKYRVHSSTTNYVTDYKEYLTSKEKFYKRSAEIVGMAMDMSKGTSAFRVAEAYQKHFSFLGDFMTMRTKRSDTFTSLLDFLKVFKVFSNKYLYLWIIAGIFKIFGNWLATRFYYEFNMLILGI